MDSPGISQAPRVRFTRDRRREQLVEIARQMIRDEGTDAVTLGRVATAAGVSKPVVYSHFATRGHLLLDLYATFEERQVEYLDRALDPAPASLTEAAAQVSASYMQCVEQMGAELPGVRAALVGDPELDAAGREIDAVYDQRFHDALAPFAPDDALTSTHMAAIFGAARGLSEELTTGRANLITVVEILQLVIVSTVSALSSPR